MRANLLNWWVPEQHRYSQLLKSLLADPNSDPGKCCACEIKALECEMQIYGNQAILYALAEMSSGKPAPKIPPDWYNRPGGAVILGFCGDEPIQEQHTANEKKFKRVYDSVKKLSPTQFEVNVVDYLELESTEVGYSTSAAHTTMARYSETAVRLSKKEKDSMYVDIVKASYDRRGNCIEKVHMDGTAYMNKDWPDIHF